MQPIAVLVHKRRQSASPEQAAWQWESVVSQLEAQSAPAAASGHVSAKLAPKKKGLIFVSIVKGHGKFNDL